MSQQINLLLPSLRPRFDWLGLPVVAGLALAGLLLMLGLSLFGAMQSESLKTQEMAVRSQLAGLQQQVQSLGQSLGARKGDSGLDGQLAETRLAVSQRQEVLDLVAQGDVAGGSTYSGLLQGFSRQVHEGVWLVGFSFSGKDIEIKGRLTDPALLPVYIGRLNGEPAFAGRRFAALDMTGVDPSVDENGAKTTSTVEAAKPHARYTEFALRTRRQEATP